MGVPVVGFKTWQVKAPDEQNLGIVYADNPKEAVKTALQLVKQN